MLITHFVLLRGKCKNCDQICQNTVPERFQVGYGERLTALIGGLSGSQRCVDRVSEAILPYYEAIAARARSSKVNHMDETSWYQHGLLCWLWVIVNSTVAFFSIKTGRTKEAFKELIGHWADIFVSDNYRVYRKWVNLRQTCLAHLIRTAEGLVQRKDETFSWFGRRARSELQRLTPWANAPPTKGEVATWYARMCHLIARYKDRKDEAGRLVRLLESEMGSLWVFLLEDVVDPTSNRAGRALRFAVLWRRMMQNSFNEKGDRWVERIRSLRETCRLRGLPTFPMLVEALTCARQNRTPDISWI